MAITPAIASHKVRHPSWSPSNFSAFIASDFKKLAAVTFALRVRGWGVRRPRSQLLNADR
jgi:hypothetical protein